jgi:hypothetical protein
MAKISTHVLLVEGFADRDFFEQVCKLLDLSPLVTVATSKDYQGARNTKEDIFKLLPDLLTQIGIGKIERLAVVVDADKLEHGSGYEKTLNKVKEITANQGFALAENQTNGLIFKHNEELTDFGLWIMPNNQDEGMLENFIKQCVKNDELPLFNHAVQTVQNLPEPKKFEPHHETKAEVATWLAWQKKPGHGLYHSVQVDLLDTNHALFQEMAQWLKKIFI